MLTVDWQRHDVIPPQQEAIRVLARDQKVRRRTCDVVTQITIIIEASESHTGVFIVALNVALGETAMRHDRAI